MTSSIRVAMLSKACVVESYQGKLEQIASYDDIDLTVIVPPHWQDKCGTLPLESAHGRGYKLLVEPILFNGSYHCHFYPRLHRRLIELQPHVVHIDEEPYNLATWHAMLVAQRLDVRTLFFSWQNIQRQYPWPFSAIEAYVLCKADAAIFGTAGARLVWRAKGYSGPEAIIPQFGIDPEIFPMRVKDRHTDKGFSVGFVGRLVHEKGVDILLRAIAELPHNVHLTVIGVGPERASLGQLVEQLGLSERVVFEPRMPSMEIPERLRGLDVLVLPSRTTTHWKEQFGRVLLEAMSSGTPVVGADSGEIASVIGAAGLLFPEGDSVALAAALRRLSEDNTLCQSLAQNGRERVLTNFTQVQVADETVSLYRNLVSKA